MAVQKLAFLALAFACLMQNAVAAPDSVGFSGGHVRYSAPRELEIIGQALTEIGKSASDFIKSVVTTVTRSVGEGMTKVLVSLYLKAHVVLSGSGLQDSSLSLTEKQFFDYRVLASTLLRLRQKLDVMETFEEVYESILADLAPSFLDDLIKMATESKEDPTPAEIYSPLIPRFCETADRHLKQHPKLKDVYLRVREQVKSEEVKVKPFLVAITQSNSYTQQKMEQLPNEIRAKIVKAFVNKQFLHHTVNRISVLNKEDFLVARSTLELAKKPNKLNLVQKVYDETLDKVRDPSDVSGGLFEKLKNNFETNPALNREWREVQRDVSQSHEWNKIIWDLDLNPF